MTIWRMRIECRIPKATNTHSEYVILIAFPLQQWLHKRSSKLRYTYIACIVSNREAQCLLRGTICTFTRNTGFLYTWVRASWIEFNNCPTRCDLFSLLHFCRQLYMFRVLTPIIRSSYNCNYSFWYWLTGSTTIRSRCWVGTDSCVSYGR